MLSRRPALLILLFLVAPGFVVQSWAAMESLSQRPSMVPPPTAPPSPTKRLKPGRKVTWRMLGPDARFVFAGRAGEVITLRVNSKSPGLDPQVTLLDPERKVEALDDDSGGQGNSLIANHTLKQTGQYTVLVESDGEARGKMAILFKKARSKP